MESYDKIDWKQGMEVVPQTFIEAEKTYLFLQKINRKLTTLKSYGLLPDTKFEIISNINNNILEIKELHCQAITQKGSLFRINGNLSVALSSSIPGEYYIVAIEKQEPFRFEINEIPYLKTEYIFEMRQWRDLSMDDMFPLQKVKNDGTIWEIMDYIPPSIALSSHRKLQEKYGEIRNLLRLITEHSCVKNITKDFFHFSIYVLELNNYTKNESPYELILLLKKIFYAFHFHSVNSEVDFNKFIEKEYNHNEILGMLQHAVGLLSRFYEIMIREETKEEPTEPESPQIEEEIFDGII